MSSSTSTRTTPVWRIVAEREFMTKVRDKTFIGATAFTLLFLIGFFVVGSIIDGNSDDFDVAVVDGQDTALVQESEVLLQADLAPTTGKRSGPRPLVLAAVIVVGGLVTALIAWLASQGGV